MNKTLQDYGIAENQPLYIYQSPMFMVTVSTVLIVENGVVMVEKDDEFRFPGGRIKAGQETIQFAAIRHVKEQTGIALTKEILIPADFRSSPERSREGNIIDIGFVCTFDHPLPENHKWMEVDFENRCLVKEMPLYMDHDILLQRAIDIVVMMRG